MRENRLKRTASAATVLLATLSACAAIDKAKDTADSFQGATDNLRKMAVDIRGASEGLDPFAYKAWTSRLFELLAAKDSLSAALEQSRRELDLVKRGVVYLEIDYKVRYADASFEFVDGDNTLGPPLLSANASIAETAGTLRVTGWSMQTWKLQRDKAYTLRAKYSTNQARADWTVDITINEIRGQDRIAVSRYVLSNYVVQGVSKLDIPFMIPSNFIDSLSALPTGSTATPNSQPSGEPRGIAYKQ